ncbi:MAG: hypothetical protein HYX33_03205 [Actinobacteria bacterium]|nr:hypothetical protein [Actinomycetota bacterium]
MAKVLVTLPDELLRRIDAAARLRSTTRSALVQSLAEREFGSSNAGELHAQLDALRSRLARSARRVDTTAAVRAGRDALDARDRKR